MPNQEIVNNFQQKDGCNQSALVSQTSIHHLSHIVPSGVTEVCWCQSPGQGEPPWFITGHTHPPLTLTPNLEPAANIKACLCTAVWYIAI